MNLVKSLWITSITYKSTNAHSIRAVGFFFQGENMNKRQKDFLGLLQKQQNLVTYAILITEGRTHFGKADEETDSFYWDHDTPVTLKEHKEWLRNDTDYQERSEFIKELVLDTIERAGLRQLETNPALVFNVLKTKLKGRGYTTDDNVVLDVGEIWVGFSGEDE